MLEIGDWIKVRHIWAGRVADIATSKNGTVRLFVEFFKDIAEYGKAGEWVDYKDDVVKATPQHVIKCALEAKEAIEGYSIPRIESLAKTTITEPDKWRYTTEPVYVLDEVVADGSRFLYVRRLFKPTTFVHHSSTRKTTPREVAIHCAMLIEEQMKRLRMIDEMVDGVSYVGNVFSTCE